MADGALTLPLDTDPRQLEVNLQRAVAALDRSMNQMEARASASQKTLNNILSKIGGATPKAPPQIKSIQDAINRIDQGDLSKALGNVFDRSRLAVLEEGGAKLPIFGSALADLGPAGLTAAAGLVAAGAALEGGRKFTEFAAEVERTSKALGLTTTQVQEFAHVADALNIPVDRLDESMAGLERSIGLVESGLARSISVKAFTEGLKITPEQLRGWGTLEQQLPHILDAAARLNVEERNGLASRLKVDPEVLNSLVDGRAKISDLIAEAHKYGLVLDEDVIKKGAEANEKLKTASEIINTNLKVAFADAVPVVVSMAGAIADATRDLNEFIQSFKDLQDRNQGALYTERARLLEERSYAQSESSLPVSDRSITSILPRGLGGTRSVAEIDADIDRINSAIKAKALAADLADLAAGTGVYAPKAKDLGGDGKSHAHADATAIANAEKQYLEALLKTTTDLDAAHAIRLRIIDAEYRGRKAEAETNTSLNSHARDQVIAAAALTRDADVAAENAAYAKAIAGISARTKAADDALDEATTRQLEAQAALTGDIQQRADAEKRAVAAELARQQTDLAAQAEEIDNDKNLTEATKVRLKNELILASLADAEAADAKNRKTDRDAAFKIEDQQIGIYKDVVDAQIATLEAQKAIATSAKQRRILDEKILELKQQEERDLEGTKLDREVSEGTITPEQRQTEWNAFLQKQAAERTAASNEDLGPIGDAVKNLQDQSWQGVAVEGVNSLGDALVRLATRSEGAGKAFKDMATSIISDILRLAIQKEIEIPLLQALGLLSNSPLPAGGGAGAGFSLFSGLGSLFGGAGGAAAAPGSGAGAFGGILSAVGGFFHLLGFAGGTDSAPGGWVNINERGPEGLAYVPKGTQIIPNSTLRALAGVGASRGAGVSVYQPLHFHAEGAVTTSELLAQMAAISRAQAGQAAASAVAQSRAGLARANDQDRLLKN